MRTSAKHRCEETTALAERALANRQTLREAASASEGSERTRRALEHRALRCFKDTAGGDAFAELFLKKRSWYRLEAAALLVCRPDEVDTVIAKGRVSLKWIARHAPSGRRAYHFWYTQLCRNWPAELAEIQGRAGAVVRPSRSGGRTLASPSTTSEPANPAFAGGYNFFDVDTYEFAPDRQ